MAVKKSQLYSSLWQSCDELRGGMDASQYKDYVLVMLFVKYVSDKYAGQPFAPITIPAGASFADMVKLKGKTSIGDDINKFIIGPLYKANNLISPPDFNDSTKLGTGKEFVQRLTKLIAIFENPALDFSKNRADGDDLLGDAYEFLMRHFATESGKSKGQFYTPAEVSRVIAQILGIHSTETSRSTTVYDPACGSGSLLLKVAAAATTEVSLYGQEKDSATAGLAKMNMILHNQPGAEVKQGNTLASPLFMEEGKLKTFDFVVANPPFSDKRWSTGLNPLEDEYGRFKHFGVPPTKQGDYAYLLHIVRSLKSTGKGACILPHGVLFRGNAEAEIRTNLLRRGLIKGIIGLPANLFYGTGIPACIIVIDKEGAAARDTIFMVDASRGFIKDGSKNRLREMDLHRIVDVFTRQSATDPKYARLVSITEIEQNDFNLNIPRYIDNQVAEDVQDIDGHLRGGIPVRDVDGLARYWAVYPTLRLALFTERRPGYLDLTIAKSAIKATISAHPEFVAFTTSMEALFGSWRSQVQAKLKALSPGFHPKELIAELGEGILDHYENKPLVDSYAVYQHLRDYWAETMQDDTYFIAADGWTAKTHRVIETDKKGKQKDKGWTCDLVPKELIVARYFAADAAALAALQSQLEALSAELAELEEEHDSEEGSLSDVSNKSDAKAARVEAMWTANGAVVHGKYTAALETLEDKQEALSVLEEGTFIAALANARGKVTQGAVKARLKEASESGEVDALKAYLRVVDTISKAKKAAKTLLSKAEEAIETRLAAKTEDSDLHDLRVLDTYLSLSERIAAKKKAIKDANKALDAKAFAKYPELTEDEIKVLVVDDKWIATLSMRIHEELDRISQALTQRMRVLTERYETPLPLATKQVAALQAKVDQHLQQMGFTWT